MRAAARSQPDRLATKDVAGREARHFTAAHTFRCLTLALLLCAAAAGAGRAQDGDAAQRALVARYVAALTAGDGAALMALYHPATLACMTAQNRDYYDFVFARELNYGADLRGGYKLAYFRPLGADAAGANDPAGMFPNPVPPTHAFQLDTPLDRKGHSLTIMRVAAERDGAWYIVLGCPTAEGLASFRARRAEGERQQAHIKELAGALPEPLLSEIRNLLAQDRRIDAIRRYREAANADLVTATQVVDLLAKQ